MRKLSSAEAYPPDPTPLQLGVPVRCTDGRVGTLSDVVIDPSERRVSHIVVEAPNGDARLVPADLLLQGPAPGRAVFLSCSIEEVLHRATIRSFSLGAADLRRGSIAVSLDGDEIGTVDAFLVAGARLTHIVLQHTHLTGTGTAEIPIDSVTAIETDRITVALPDVD